MRSYPVKKVTNEKPLYYSRLQGKYSRVLTNTNRSKGEKIMAEVKVEDGIIKVIGLDIQDPKIAKILAEYPENRWCEVTRRAIKIGLGYLQGGAQD